MWYKMGRIPELRKEMLAFRGCRRSMVISLDNQLVV
jgi:hypothetical protein